MSKIKPLGISVIDSATTQQINENFRQLDVQTEPTSIASNYTFKDTDTIDSLQVNASGGNRTITLPSPTGTRRRRIIKTDISANIVTIIGTINGATNYTLSVQYAYVDVEPTGTAWLIIGAGVITLAANVASFLAAPTSANLRAAMTDETGTGVLVFGTSPTIINPAINGGSINGTPIGATTRDGGEFDSVAVTNDVEVGGNVTVSGTTELQSVLDLSGSTAGQIVFPSTQNASSNVNTLDDYEEGTWTPSLGGNTTYSSRGGTYTKIGRLVFIYGNVNVNTLGTGSTSTISGLPFTTAVEGSIGIGNWANLATATVRLGGYFSGTSIILSGTTAANTTVTVPFVAFGDSAGITFSGIFNV